MLLNKLGYDPYGKGADAHPNGVLRPPDDPACACDYFHALSFTEDGGRFAIREMAQMLKHPEKFFSPLPKERAS